MNNSQSIESTRKFLIENILKCLEGNAPKEAFIQLAEKLNNIPEIDMDLSLIQSHTLLDFLSKQLINGNYDLVSQQIFQESCTYMLSKLVPRETYIS